ncbi:MAG: prepilin-type N-terminal cleavage/methylation domain-containing protein [Pirellulaceae bacterium]|jgi:prepilin-type N-terminal cleavage/methylation domain-containing protein|nr:prepilin-type N-terminal cleavage/methylation domain-containing protein [Pirellulaceae bacterium]
MNDRRNRNGFTLLEVIIASSLAATLMLLVWSLFSIYSKLNDKGARQATELQIVRSLMRQLHSDLHHARSSWMSTRDGFPAVSQTLNDGASTAFAGDGTDLISLPPGAQLLGSDTRFRLVVRAPRRRAAHGSVERTAVEEVPPPDLCDVVEYIWKPRPELLPPGDEFPAKDDVQQRFADVGDEGQAAGLVRRVTPWFLPNTDEDTARSNENGTAPSRSSESGRGADMDPQRLQQQMIHEDAVPEIVTLQFRYFDGTVWLSHWDSRQTGRLPAAVEIAFDVQAEEQQLEEQQTDERQLTAGNHADQQFLEDTSRVVEMSRVADNDIADEAEQEYRFVIAVDTTKPLRANEEVMMP